MTCATACGQPECRYCSRWRPDVIARMEALWRCGDACETIRQALYREYGMLFTASAIAGKAFRRGLDKRRRSSSPRRAMALVSAPCSICRIGFLHPIGDGTNATCDGFKCNIIAPGEWTSMPNQTNSIWLTPGLVDRLRELHAKGLRGSEIRDILAPEFDIHLTRKQITEKLNRLDLAAPKSKIGGLSKETVTRHVNIARQKAKLSGAGANSLKRSKLASITSPVSFATGPVPPPDLDAPKRWNGEPLPESQSMSILSVTCDHCKWPLFEAEIVGGMWFCGAPATDGSPYCLGHWLRSKSKAA